MENGAIYASELSTARHSFSRYHFCRGNSNKRKSRLGVILKGSGVYLYMGKRLRVGEGDVVFIPEDVYCYSEWRGEPDIDVVYVSCFLHYERFAYEPQVVACTSETVADILRIARLLEGQSLADTLEAYALFYGVLRELLPRMQGSTLALDKTLQAAIEYITGNWNRDFSMAEVAGHCLVSESTLYHLFQRELGQTPLRFLHSIRVNVAIEYLENSNYSVSHISREVGFHSENHFRRIFTELTGSTPLKYRKGK